MDRFVGRAVELDLLRGSLAEAATEPRVAIVVGEAGVGKTSLLRELAAGVPHTAWGRCFDGEVAALAPWRDALGDLGVDAAAAPLGAADARSRAFDAVVQRLLA